MDLTKTIKINKNYEISYGMALFTCLVTLFEVLGILCFNDWRVTPAIFFMIANMFLMIRRQAGDDSLEHRIEKLEDKS